MYNYMVKQLQNFRLQIQLLGPFSVLFNPDHDLFQGITLVFIEKICEQDQTMYNYIVAKLQNVKLQMKSMVNILDLHKVTSQNMFVSDDLNPDLDPVQAIAPVFSKTSKFFTPLRCDLEPEINKITLERCEELGSFTEDWSSCLDRIKIRSQIRRDDNLPRGEIG